MNVSLTPELERRIAEKIESGLYTSASEVIREGLRLLFETEELREHRAAQLREGVQAGLDQLERGEGIPAAKVRAEVTERIGALRKR